MLFNLDVEDRKGKEQLAHAIADFLRGKKSLEQLKKDYPTLGTGKLAKQFLKEEAAAKRRQKRSWF